MFRTLPYERTISCDVRVSPACRGGVGGLGSSWPLPRATDNRPMARMVRTVLVSLASALALGGVANAQSTPGGAGGKTVAVMTVASAHVGTEKYADCARRFRWQPAQIAEECGGSKDGADGDRPPEIDPLQRGAQYLTNAQTRDGLFRYEFNFLSSRYSRRVNVVRQTGAGFGLAEYFLFSKDESVRDAVFASIEAYSAMSEPWQNGKLVTTDGDLNEARAGATALALLTELQYQEASGDQRGKEIRKSWVLGLLALYRQGKGFAEIPGAKTESNIYNGEGWLALAYYDFLFPDDVFVSSVLDRLDDYLMRTSDEKPNTQIFHWGVMAAAKRYQATGDKKFAEFVARQATAFLDKLRSRVRRHTNTCASVEGLMAAAALLESAGTERSLRSRVVKRAAAEMEKNARFQIVSGQEQVALGDERYLYSKEISKFAGAFLNGLYRPQVRIDYTQHCLSAMIKYRKFGAE